MSSKALLRFTIMSIASSAVHIQTRSLSGYATPDARGRRALLVRYSRRAAGFCAGYRRVARISTPDGSDERGEPIARCTLDGTLAHVWSRIVATSDYTRY